MKNKLIYLFASAVLIATGCSQETPAAGDGLYRLHIGGTVDATVATRAAATPTTADFALKITDAEGAEQSWETITKFNQEAPVFTEGDYTVFASYGDANAEGLDKPYYSASKGIRIRRRTTNNVELTATIGNSQAVVRATQQFLDYYSDAQFTITTGSGNKFTFTPEEVGDGVPVWVKTGTTLTVKGTARKQSQTGTIEGLTITFNDETLDNTKAATCHIFTFDAQEAGSATLEITYGDEPAEIREVDSEMNDAAIKDEE